MDIKAFLVNVRTSYTLKHIQVSHHLFTHSGVAKGKNCAFYDTSMKLGTLIYFEALKKIGSGPQRQSASKLDFKPLQFGPRPPGSFAEVKFATSSDQVKSSYNQTNVGRFISTMIC